MSSSLMIILLMMLCTMGSSSSNISDRVSILRERERERESVCECVRERVNDVCVRERESLDRKSVV